MKITLHNRKTTETVTMDNVDYIGIRQPFVRSTIYPEIVAKTGKQWRKFSTEFWAAECFNATTEQ